MPFPSPGDLPDPGIEPVSLAPPALTGGFFINVPPGKQHRKLIQTLVLGSEGTVITNTLNYKSGFGIGQWAEAGRTFEVQD